MIIEAKQANILYVLSHSNREHLYIYCEQSVSKLGTTGTKTSPMDPESIQCWYVWHDPSSPSQPLHLPMHSCPNLPLA